MAKSFKTSSESDVRITELMLPSHSNFGGKIHGGYIMSLMDQIAFACASKHSEHYCVTASVDTVDFINPVEVGHLLTMHASINYVGKSSMVVGIRVESENIRTGDVLHCNSSYFTMVAKDDKGNNATVPGLILESEDDVRRFVKAIKRKQMNVTQKQEFNEMDFTALKYVEELENYNVKVTI
jgi:uncharacterized protein (TIGR00369 family)